MKTFKKIYIEITNICNLSCDFCPQTKRVPEFMKIETFSKILDQIKPFTDYIYLHVKGEPLLHPELGKFLDISYLKGFKVNITTNGTLIKQLENILLSKPALRQINFSLHSFDGNKLTSDKNEYINNILSFVRNANETNIIMAFRLWNLTKDNTENIQKKRNQQIIEIIENEFSLPYKIEEKVTPGRGIKIKKNVYLNQDHEFDWPDLKADEYDGDGFCYALRSHAGILVDGTVVPCCLDGEGILNLGNINSSDFADIIDSPRANAIYYGFSTRKASEELCRKCGYRKRFGNKSIIL